MSIVFLLNALVEGAVGSYLLLGATTDLVPLVVTPNGDVSGHNGMLAEVVGMLQITFGTVPALVVWLTGAPRKVAMPVALGCLAYHVALAARDAQRVITGQMPIGLHPSMNPLPKRESLPMRLLLGATGLHGLLAVGFVLWLLFPAQDRKRKVE
ncbi:hypothetical protein HK105_208215 [Polyrhizophydium stewartii]|uniref:Uncharacterized protein n=1 Tax=Polyrhizophydium stewartii TaxID=2732419 RepID=A0ABR4MYE5_9FUNG|nr:hypothetical protein HK105_004536 [Polyrhizophydium stewartii]